MRGRQPPERHSLIVTKHGEGFRLDGPISAFVGLEYPSTSCMDDGVWIKWTWRTDELVIETSWLGFRPAYYFASGTRFGVSTSVCALLDAGAPPDLDDEAIAVFLRLGFFLGDDTPFRHIRAVPKDARLRWRDGKLTFEARGRSEALRRVSLSREEALESFAETFQAVVERQLGLVHGEVCLPLSGGRDSRHILLAMARAKGLPAHCVTIATATSTGEEEMAAAAQLTKMLGLDHTVLRAPQSIVQSQLLKNELTNFCADEHAEFLPLRSFFQHRRFEFAFDGIGGDILSAGLFLTRDMLELFESRCFRRLAEHLLGPEYLPKILSREYRSRWSRELAVERVAAEATRHADSPNPVAQLYFWSRTRREIALVPWGIVGEPPQVLAPYLDMDVYSLLASLPAAYFLDQSFHTESIARFYPSYAAVPYARKRRGDGRARLTARLRFLRDMLQLGRRFEGLPSSVSGWFLASRLGVYVMRSRNALEMEDVMAKSIYLAQLEWTIRKASSRGV